MQLEFYATVERSVAFDFNITPVCHTGWSNSPFATADRIFAIAISSEEFTGQCKSQILYTLGKRLTDWTTECSLPRIENKMEAPNQRHPYLQQSIFNFKNFYGDCSTYYKFVLEMNEMYIQ